MHRSILALVALLLLTPLAARAQFGALPPDDPRVGPSEALMEILLRRDRAAAAAFLAEHGTPSFAGSAGMDEALDRHFATLAAGDFVVEQYRPGLGNDVVVMLRERETGRPDNIVVQFEISPPHRIFGLIKAQMGGPPGEGDQELPTSIEMDAEARTASVRRVAELLEANYAVPEDGRAIAAHLRERLAAGAYDALTTLPDLAEVLTVDLRAVNGDKHLSVSFAMAGAAGPKAGAPQDPRRKNYSFDTVQHLEGNVGYLKIDGILSSAPEAFQKAELALRLLQDTDAFILDLRGVPGGSGEMANFLVSHFAGPDVHTLDVLWRAQDDTSRTRTLREVPGPRRTDVPLFVLVDGGSASAAEDIPFVLQNLGRATIVGETTAGAGRNNSFFPAGNGLTVSVSVTRVMEPGTGREWEGTGVVPDLPAPSADALARAHLEALDRLAARAADEPLRRELRLAREYAQARYAPPAVSPEQLAAYAGTYEGGRSVVLEDGALFYRSKPGFPLFRLLPLSATRFALGPTNRIAFVRADDGTLRLALETSVQSAQYARL